MSAVTPRSESYAAIYGVGLGRGDLEAHVIKTLAQWIVSYIADYEAEHGLSPRTLPIPPSPSSIHGGIDHETFRSDLFPEIIVVVSPTGEVERFGDDGSYGSWFEVNVGAIVQFEGDQDLTRMQADAYGTALQKLLPQQGAFGTNPDGTPFAERTRLQGAYGLGFPVSDVRDIVRATTSVHTFIYQLVADFEGPRVPPTDPYRTPESWPVANRVNTNILRATPDQYKAGGEFTSDSIIIDGTVNPPITELEQILVDVPPDTES